MTRPRQILLATRNPGKVKEIRQVLAPLGVDVATLEGFEHVAEPVEDGATFAENARKKALYYAAATDHWCLADDSGLAVDALGGRPGVHSARYAADRVGSDAPRCDADPANNAKLLDELAGVPDQRRSARFVCHLVLARPDEVLLEACGTVEGRIGREPRGENGFGYDPLFCLPQHGCTTAELAPEQKNAISHRGKAVRELAGKLSDLLSSLD